jgi:DNA-binding MurR/RpiR family transcriptional regulator
MAQQATDVGAGAAAPAPSDVLVRIRAMLPGMSAAEARIGRILQADPAAASAMTVNELAGQASTSTATVVRTARRLGFDGYPQLRLALAAHGAGQTEPVVPLGADITDDDDAAAVLAKLASFESEQLRATAELVDPAALDKVIALIGSARRIDVYGIAASGLVAMDLTAKLGRLGLNAHALTEHDAALVSACLLGPADLAIGISHSGENRGTVEPLRTARAAGAGTAAITGAARSALAGHAEHLLLTAGREFGFRSAAMASRTGQLLIVDGLFVGVAQTLPGARDALHRTYAAVAPGSGRGR